MGKIKLTIDGMQVEAEGGMTVLQAARMAGIKIPTVCDHKDLDPYGACRMCIVEIDGVRGYPTSCTTPAAEGMTVRTQTQELQTLRSRILELMLSGHPNTCLVCDHREACEKYRPKPTKAGKSTRCALCSNRGDCSIREMALESKTRELDLHTFYSAHNLERDDPFMDRDYNLCVLCGRCWRICEKIHGAPAISITGRGKWAKLGTAFGKSHIDSGCTFCGSCIDICPTGTLTDRYARWYGQPDSETLSACSLCPEGCELVMLSQAGQAVATRMTEFTPEASLCAIGRFGYAQILNAPDRLRMPAVRENGDLIPVDWQTAMDSAAERLGRYPGSVAIIVSESLTREDRFLYEKLARALNGRIASVPAGEDMTPPEISEDIKAGRIKAVISGGKFLDDSVIGGLECIVSVDCLPSGISRAADVILPAAILSEVEGSFRNSNGQIRNLAAVTRSPGESKPEWMIVRDLARAMGLTGFDYDMAGAISAEISSDAAPNPVKGNPRHNVRDIPAHFRGHFVADFVCSLGILGLPTTPSEPEAEVEGGFIVLETREIVPNLQVVKIEAPQIAKYAKPGQFVIVMAKETSERVPFTLIDWDEQEGWIKLVIEEVGRSSREAIAIPAGGRFAHVTGPLGLPFPIEKKGTVVLGGGCYGIGGIYPVARAMKEAGNRVVAVIEAASSHLLYMEDELRAVCDELLIATKDGSKGTKGGVQEVFVNLHKSSPVDMFIAIGCTFMMRMVAEATRPLGVSTWVALNPIMVDGTGMCGACRLSVDGATKFACVDGPAFDAHKVDWDELFSRRGAYAKEEVEAMPQMAEIHHSGHGHDHGSGCGCGH